MTGGDRGDKFYLDKRMRAFVYLSRAKVGMLYSQTREPIRKRLAVKLGISVPMLPVTAEAQITQPTPNDTGMLRVVLSRLDQDDAIGTVDAPRGYFAGQLDLRWGTHEEFLFLSAAAPGTLIVLTGSNRHLVGQADADVPKVDWPGSSRIGLDRVLRRIFAAEDDQQANATDLVRNLALAQRLRGPQETLEFVAQRLAYDDEGSSLPVNWHPSPEFEQFRDGRFKVLLGTPLYLAYPA
jgi:hypothetical protein